MSLKLIRQFHSTRPTYIVKNLLTTLENTAPKPFQVVQVNRPIGFPKEPVPESPSQKPKHSVWSSIQDMFDKDKKLARRKELEEEMSKSGFYDVHYYNKLKGKMFIPPISFFKNEKSLYFPNLVGQNLLDQMVNTTDLYKGKITIVRIMSSQLGEQHSDSYFKIPNSDKKSYLTDGYVDFQTRFPHAQISDLNLSENNMKHLLMGFARSNLKKIIPKERHNLYLTGRRSDVSKQIKDTILMNNRYACNLYVLDPECKIRWLTVGSSTDLEYNLLYKCLSTLEKELQQKNLL